jgi:hypothetical protein
MKNSQALVRNKNYRNKITKENQNKFIEFELEETA